MAEKVDMEQMVVPLTEAEYQVICGALGINNQQESTSEVQVELNEETPRAESSSDTPSEEIDIDDLLNCFSETYDAFCSKLTADNQFQQQHVPTPAYSEHCVASSLTNQQPQSQQIPSHWPTLYSVPKDADSLVFVSPKLYNCKFCRKHFLSRAALTRHMNNYHAKRHLRCWECGFFPKCIRT
ncbi:hypothetical protein TSAR_006840 [Trichomalopsis sarcophagae]|uniref:C2H2-type domain-containing protein n=1 Tax=Trichomalopsis sarcophagae TaxID=543379 RepID=A0A232FC94_9HYME|nr:hypothetical protein TSAR_006840 [Trichomalopsis sarcophagae]